MRNFLKENWFKLVVALSIFLIGASFFFYFVIFVPHKESSKPEANKQPPFFIKLDKAEIQHDPNDLAWGKLSSSDLGKRLMSQWGYDDKSTTGKFVVLSWQTTNDGKNSKKIAMDTILAKDQLERALNYLNISSYGCTISRVSKIVVLQPGIPCNVYVLYEVPENADFYFVDINYKLEN